MYLTFTQTLNVNPRLLSKNVISVFFASLAGLMFFSPTAASGELYPEIKPDPVYTPDEVVGIQMRALGKNNQPYDNAGIELTFRFASPGNKKNTGPLARFKTLFDNSGYRAMLKYQNLDIGESVLIQNFAKIPVIVTSQSGRRAAYLFTLSKQQSAPFENCWMTDSVVRVQISGTTTTIL